MKPTKAHLRRHVRREYARLYLRPPAEGMLYGYAYARVSSGWLLQAGPSTIYSSTRVLIQARRGGVGIQERPGGVVEVGPAGAVSWASDRGSLWVVVDQAGVRDRGAGAAHEFERGREEDEADRFEMRGRGMRMARFRG